ncbi:MAG: pyridoxal 5'-phosphate synthase glutaminase subunit PdxT [Megasphaera sp.]|uniref:pyridoxal 5'-phosphate synthase glutaminase subunit PdxT n=1 Tax=Megasphaera sueciensis TaxID=349094 RepID=UPI003D025345|nr:pyridoxal 5'-phosphate synthase glutaminase subunit PdxT [Megasphaera sp.]MCI1822979.1 pyridoxal 5'-phosphate synthase glutaminase subunit PdxT [Megasphaera sp.]
MKTIGVLAMQGAVSEHLEKLYALGIQGHRVRTETDLNNIDGLILPGGESTVMGKLLEAFNLLLPLTRQIEEGLPVWGTCAGLILLAKTIIGQEKTYLSTMNITVRRNAYGSQMESFITQKTIFPVSTHKIPLVFIRAPYIESVKPDVTILTKVNGKIVAAKQKNMLATSFHPELTKDISFHHYFVSLC